MENTARAHYTDISRVTAEALDCSWSLIEFRFNDSSAAGGSSGTNDGFENSIDVDAFLSEHRIFY